MSKDTISFERSFEGLRAILHFDGDAFFSSVEQIMDYRLRGKPVVTGGERREATSLSYEAKAFGLHRGMTIREIRMRCPSVIIVPSDYTAYAIFAHRMYSIVRQYTADVEEYSIDECFADITDLPQQLHLSYEEIALRIKEQLETSLGITFGVGLAPTKTLAKAASKANKPAGLTVVRPSQITSFISSIPISNVWGFGGASGVLLKKLGATTALEFVQKEDAWLTEHRLGKAYRDIWLELCGHSVKHLSTEHSGPVGSLMTTRTFAPPTNNRSLIFSYLSKNVEHVCEKARRHKKKARGISFYLKTQEFTYHSVSLELSVPISTAPEVLAFIEQHFDEVYVPGILYRASGITLRSLLADQAAVPDLFGESILRDRKGKMAGTIDAVNERYGKQTLFLASSLSAISSLTTIEENERKKGRKGKHSRQSILVDIEKKYKTLSMPYLGTVR
ncbi:DNA polymerase IV [Patescibacteria group bacterium]|nr:DNA polymerase IV [Patescibacteria group bacterium]